MYNLATVENRGFVDKMKASNRRMVVFYGSQTGTAEEFAGRLAKEGARYGCKVRNLDEVQNFVIHQLREEFLLTFNFEL